MKKNRMMRLASFMLVAVLLTTCTISGTYAKYVTSATGNDTARVAKWGVEVSGMADTLFGKTYAKDSTTGIANTVTATEDVVAPGTKNDTGVTFKITGTPEVAVNVKIALSGTGVALDDAYSDVVLPAGNHTDWTKAPYTSKFDLAAAYHPVVFTLSDGSTELVSGTLAQVEAFLEDPLVNKDYAPGTDLSTILGGSTGTYTLTWEWPFNDGSKDKEDTLLGNIAAGKDSVTGASTSVSFAIDIVVTQVD